jgi:hypothetical protein
MARRDLPPATMPGAVQETASGAPPKNWPPAEWKAPLIDDLEGQHPYYSLIHRDWTKLGLLYLGGYMLRQNSTEFLERRDRELQEVYQARVDKFTDRCILGTVLGWYQGALFKNPPTIALKIGDADGNATDKKVAADTEGFFNRFQKDCDRGGSTLMDFFSEILAGLLLYQWTYVLIDLPKATGQPRSLREQKQSGALDPYLMAYPPMNVINWGEDPYGNLDWAMISTQSRQRPFLGKQQTVDTWVYFDRHNFARWEFARETDEYSSEKSNANARAKLVDSGPHALSRFNECPLRRITVPDGLWLANRAYLPLLDYLNNWNAYKWALRISCLAMPVITGAPNYKPTLSEVGYINLPDGAKWEWSEPPGRAYKAMADMLADLREDIYRLMHVTYQGRAASAVSDSASGESKKTDMMPAQDVLNRLGDALQGSLQNTLDLVAKARGETAVLSDVRWPNVGKASTIEDVQKTQAILATGIQSESFNKEVQKDAMENYLPNANPEEMEKWRAEVDAAPSREEQAQQITDRRSKLFAEALEVAGTTNEEPSAKPDAANQPPQPQSQPAVPAKRKRAA